MKDIATEEDIKTLVESFYARVNQDALLSPVFNHVAQVEWEHHIPLLCQFWSKLLFHSTTYKGNPLAKHLPLPVEKAHFDRWLQLFLDTIDSHFEGPKALEAKGYAQSIADTFQVRMGLRNFPPKQFPPIAPRN